MAHRPTRRDLVRALGLLPALGCGGIVSDPAEPPEDTGFGRATGSTGLTDTGSAATEPLPVTKRPWVQFVGPGSARLRFEALSDLEAVLEVGGVQIPFAATRQEVSYVWDGFGLGADDFLPDEAGTFYLHEVVLDGLEPGATVSWRILAGDHTPWEGRFRAAPDATMACRIGWIADTMAPFSEDSVAALVPHAPDVVVHGGDIQYQSNPTDTWSGASRTFRPLTDSAAMHFLIGNHEFEGSNEEVQMYERLHGGQGASGSLRYHALSYGAVRFVCLDSETPGSLDEGSDQLAWLDDELAAHPLVIVSMHRPLYTLSKHAPSSTDRRDRLHARFLAHGGVPVVLAGHAHCYERFVVDGIQYVVDGGGGALAYDVNEEAEWVEANRPGEPDLRVAADQSYGVTLFDVEPGGAITGFRIDADGIEVDRYST